MQGALILPFLSDAMRTSVIGQSVNGTLSYGELKEKVLKEFKMTPAEYRRRFLDIKKEAGESWGQLAARLEMMFRYYLSSREVNSFEHLQALLIADRLKQLMPPDIRSFVTQGEMKGWLQAKELAELAANFEESTSHRVSNYQNAMAKEMRHIHRANNLPLDRMLCYACGEPGHFQRDCSSRRGMDPRNKVFRIAAKKVDTGANTFKARRSDGLEGNSTRWGNTRVRVFVGEILCTARIDSGADITVIKTSKVPAAILGQSRSNMRLTGAFGQAVTAELMYVPLGLPCPLGNATQRVPLLCAVTPELATSADLLLTPDDYESLRMAAYESEDDLEGGECGLVEGPPEQEGTLARESGVESAAHTSANNAPPLEHTAQSNKGAKGDARCEVTVGQGKEVEGDENSESKEREEVEPPPEDREDRVSATNVGAAADLLQGGHTEVKEQLTPPTESSFAKEQMDDESLADAWHQAKAGTHGMIIHGQLLFHKESLNGKQQLQLVVPKPRRAEVLELAHDSPCGGHFSEKKTKKRIKCAFFWPSLVSDVKRHCRTCHGCQVHSRKLTTDRVPITPLNRPQKPFEVVYLDCIGPMEPGSSRGHKYALSVVDLCTRWAEVIPLRAITAKATCQALIEVFARYGTPELICSDQGTNFTAKLTAELMERLGVAVRFATPDHPQSNGIVERWNGTFKGMLRHVMEEHGKDWDRYVPCLLWAYREIEHGVTGVSPFELMYGRAPHGPLSILRKSWTGEWTPPSGLNKPAAAFLKELREMMSEAARAVDERCAQVQRSYAQKYNLRARQKEFSIGDQVLVMQDATGGKMQPKWLGPLVVKERRRPDSYLIVDLEGTEKLVHANKLRPYYARTNAVGVVFEADLEFGSLETAPYASELREQCLLATKARNLSDSQKEELRSVLSDFQEVMSSRPGRCKLGEHKITLVPGARQSRTHTYKVPMALRAEVERQMSELVEWDFIYPVQSCFAHPIVCAAKKDGSIRVCVDYRNLNAITEPDSFPMGNVTELLYTIAKAKYISVLDMTRGYWQIPLSGESQGLAAFATPSGLYAWKVMPYGLRNSAATFQRIVNELLANHRQYACAYIDDVAVFSETWQDHMCHLRAVLQAIQSAGLTVNPAKCNFAQPRVKYLGHEVGSGIHAPDSDRVRAIQQLRPPKTKKELRSVLGLLNYYRDYVPEYSRLVLPLTGLTNKRVPNTLPWTAEAQHAFDAVKEALASVPGLTAPIPGKEFYLATDASERAVGACLSQEADGEERPVAFLSKKLTPAQQKWSTIEREAFAIVWALESLDTWLFGTKVRVRTDHDPLTFLARSSPSSARLTRWALALQKYDIEMVHIKGTLNKAADALSRLSQEA
uniref:RNA-directed DNA polymerase n=1 Tax=Rhipicephalus pulchellus TaxID=72859 RepID=L7LYF1_RHIPC